MSGTIDFPYRLRTPEFDLYVVDGARMNFSAPSADVSYCWPSVEELTSKTVRYLRVAADDVAGRKLVIIPRFMAPHDVQNEKYQVPPLPRIHLFLGDLLTRAELEQLVAGMIAAAPGGSKPFWTISLTQTGMIEARPAGSQPQERVCEAAVCWPLHVPLPPLRLAEGQRRTILCRLLVTGFDHPTESQAETFIYGEHEIDVVPRRDADLPLQAIGDALDVTKGPGGLKVGGFRAEFLNHRRARDGTSLPIETTRGNQRATVSFRMPVVEDWAPFEAPAWCRRGPMSRAAAEKVHMLPGGASSTADPLSLTLDAPEGSGSQMFAPASSRTLELAGLAFEGDRGFVEVRLHHFSGYIDRTYILPVAPASNPTTEGPKIGSFTALFTNGSRRVSPPGGELLVTWKAERALGALLMLTSDRMRRVIGDGADGNPGPLGPEGAYRLHVDHKMKLSLLVFDDRGRVARGDEIWAEVS